MVEGNNENETENSKKSNNQEEDTTQPEDYDQLKGIATVGLNVALFGNTIADMKNYYDIRDINSSIDVIVVLWLLRLSFCLQVFVALLAILLYMWRGGREKKKGKYERMTGYEFDNTSKEPKPRFHKELCCGMSLYQMLYLAILICILIITSLQIIASIWSASLGIELKSTHEEKGPTVSYSTRNPNITTAHDTATLAYDARIMSTTKSTTASTRTPWYRPNYQRPCSPNRNCELRYKCGTYERVSVNQ